jgi:hypothetical protein
VNEFRHRGVVALAAALALTGTSLTVAAVRSEQQPAATVAPARIARQPPGDRPRAVRPPIRPRSIPVRLDIPAIGVHTYLRPLGRAAGRSVDVPPLARDAPAGWYERSPTPGEAGAALILGHVDSARDGPAVFHRLGDLRPADTISIRRADGGTVHFVVTGVARYRRSTVPSDGVSGPFDQSGLRLITCGGGVDPASRAYRGNMIVFAVASFP